MRECAIGNSTEESKHVESELKGNAEPSYACCRLEHDLVRFDDASVASETFFVMKFQSGDVDEVSGLPDLMTFACRSRKRNEKDFFSIAIAIMQIFPLIYES